MIRDPSKTARLFLEGLRSADSQDTFASLDALVEILETKPDPEMTEVRLMNHIHSFIENLRVLESNVKSYVKDSQQNLPGSKLASLYDKLTCDGGSIYRD